MDELLYGRVTPTLSDMRNENLGQKIDVLRDFLKIFIFRPQKNINAEDKKLLLKPENSRLPSPDSIEDIPDNFFISRY